MDGMVYYGACENGKWTTGSSVSRKLIPTGKLSANEVFMTIVNPEKLTLKATSRRTSLLIINPDSGQGSAGVRAGQELPVKLEEIGSTPARRRLRGHFPCA